MKRARNTDSDLNERKTSGRSLARRYIVPLVFAFIFLVSLLVLVTLFSDNAEATWGLDVSVQPPKDKWMETTTTPQQVLFTIEVTNTGTSEENVNLTITFNDPGKPLAGWTVNPATFSVNTLGSGVTDTFQVQVTAPVDEPAYSFAQLTVYAYVKEDPTVNDQDTFIARVRPVYKVKIGVFNNENAKSADQGGTVSYILIVNNTGNAEDTIDLSVSGLPADWVAQFTPDSLDISSGGSSFSTMTLQLDDLVESTVYPIQVTATSQGDPGKTDATSTFTFVNPEYLLSITISPSPTQEGLPSNNVQYTLTVENLGNNNDLVTPGFQKLDGLSWNAFLDKGQQTIPFQSLKTWTLTISIPDEAKDWERGRVMFNATSEDPSGYDEIITITEVGKVYGISVYIPDASNTTDPGLKVYYSIEVTNIGNTNDTISLSTSGEYSSTVSPNKLINLAPDTTTTVTMDVDVPSGALAGFHYNTIIATSEDTVTTSQGDVSTEVNPVYDVVILPSGAQSKDGDPGGDPVSYQVRIINDGTDDDTISLTLEGEKPEWAGLDVYQVFVPAKSFTIINMTVVIPSGEAINNWDIIVNGSSTEDPDVWNIAIFTIRVQQTYEVTASTGDNSNSLPEGSSTVYYISVKNTGSGYDEFTATNWAEDPVATTWASISPSNFGLNAGQNLTVEITVLVPVGTNPAIYRIWFNVTSDNESTAMDNLLTLTEVTQSYEVLIAGGSEQSGESPPNTIISYQVEIYNTGTGIDSFVVEKVSKPTSNHPSWATVSHNFITDLAPNEQFIIWVNISIPQDTGGDPMDYLKIVIKSNGDPGIPPSSSSLWINTTITPERDAILTPHTDVFYREPGDIVVVTMQLKNTGTATDILTVEDVSPIPYDTWGVVALPATVTLAPDESINMTYTITIDSDVTRGESPVRLVLVVKSSGADDDVVELQNITIHINQTYGVRISTTQNTKTGDPGEEVSFKVKITNDGNDNDTFSLIDEGDELGQWEFSDVELVPKGFISIYYNLTIDSQHNTSDILITLNVTSVLDDTGMTYDLENIVIHVDPRYEIKLGVNGTNLIEVGGEETIIFNMTIKNRGTATDTYDIEPIGPNSHWATAETLTITLDPEEIVDIKIFVRPPKGSDIGISNITVNVTSQKEDSATGEYTFFADVQPSYDVFVSTSTPSVSVPAGDTATFTIKVKNKGNADDQFTFSISNMSSSWSHGPLSPVQLAPDETVSFNIQINTDSASASGLYIIYFTGTSDGDSTVSSTISLTVEVQQVYGIQLPTSVSGKNVDVENIVVYIINVKNTGNGMDNLELSLTGDVEPWTWLYYDPVENGTTIHISPPPGGSLSVYLYINPPSDYWDTFDGSVSLTIEAESLDDPDINPATDTVSVTTTVNAVYGVDILSGGFTSGDPGELISFLFDVKNTGTTTDSFNIRVDGVVAPPGGDSSLWIPEIYFTPTSIPDLGKGGQTVVSMYVDIPQPNNLYLIPPGLYNITIELSSSNDPDIKDSEVFTVNVQQLFWADIQNTVTTETVNVGDTVQFQITIKNKGNAPDLFSVEIQGDTDIPGSANWGKLTHAGSGQTAKQSLVDVPLNAGQSTDIILEISIPLRTDPGYPSLDPDDVTLTVIVKPGDEDGTEDEVDVTADINTIYEFNFNFLARSLDVEPDSSVDFTLKIENKGTSSETFTYEIFEWETDDWSAYGYTFAPTSIVIAANDIGDVILTLNTPSDLEEASSDDYSIIIKVHSSAGSADEFNNCTVHIDPVYDVELTTTGGTTKAVNVGNTVTYQFTARNTGNSPETFAFSISDQDTSSSGGGDQSTWANLYLASDLNTPVTSVTLDSGESKAMIFEIVVPSQGDPNFEELTQALRIEVEVSSESEPNIRDNFMTSTTINPIYSFEMTTTAPLNTKEGEPKQTVQFSLQIRNSGTTTDTYEFRVTSVDESIFIAPNPSNINNLGVDNHGTALFSVTIDSDNFDALAGTYPIEVTANSQEDPGVTVVITLFVEITPLGEVDMDPSSQTTTGEPEDTIDYLIKVSNKGNAEDTFDLILEGNYKEWGQILNTQLNPITKITLNATTLPGSFTDVIVRVTIPGTGETSAGQSYLITLKASSTNTEDVSTTAQVSTTIEEFVDLILEYSGSGNATRDYDPNKKAIKFSFRVTNNGNQDEESIDIRVDDLDSDWDYSPSILDDSLEPGGASTFSIEFSIPSDESVGTSEMEVYMVSSVDPSKQSDSVFITVEIIKPDLAVFSSDIRGLDDIDNLREKVGNAVTIYADIQNIGDTEAKNVQVKLYEESTLKGTKSISTIPAGGSREVSFRWTVPDEEVEITVEITVQEEIDDGNNEISPPIFLDLRPDLAFDGDLNLSADAAPGEKITLRAFVKNSGGEAEDVVIKFFDGTKLIGQDTIDIDFDETEEASVEWDVPDKVGETRSLKAEIDLDGAIGHGDEISKSVKLGDTTGAGEFFSMSGIIMLIIGFILGALIFLMIGRKSGRSSGGAAQGPQGMAGPSFGTFEKEMGADKGAKGPAAGPEGAGAAPFERMDEEGGGEEGAGPQEEDQAKPKEAARVRCPKCGRVMEVTSTQRPLQIPCECGTTLMLKK